MYERGCTSLYACECVSCFSPQLPCPPLCKRCLSVKGHGCPVPRVSMVTLRKVTTTRGGEVVATELYDDKLIYLAESGLLPKAERLVHQCVLSCFLSCTSLCYSSLLNTHSWKVEAVLRMVRQLLASYSVAPKDYSITVHCQLSLTAVTVAQFQIFYFKSEP